MKRAENIVENFEGRCVVGIFLAAGLESPSGSRPNTYAKNLLGRERGLLLPALKPICSHPAGLRKVVNGQWSRGCRGSVPRGLICQSGCFRLKPRVHLADCGRVEVECLAPIVADFDKG